MRYPSVEEKFNTIISKNTFYFQNREFEEYHEGHISSLAQNIFLLRNKIRRNGLKESVLLEHITEVEDGLEATAILTGDKFKCLNCGYSKHSDIVGAINIASRSLNVPMPNIHEGELSG